METYRAAARALALAGLAVLGSACGNGMRTTQGPSVVDDEVTFRALLIDGQLYPSDQFHLASADRCDDFHWHRASPALSIGTPGAGDRVVCASGTPVTRADPDPLACGFGRIRDLPSTPWRTTTECYAAWQRALGAAPSSPLAGSIVGP
jgi:hypothetical protein